MARSTVPGGRETRSRVSLRLLPSAIPPSGPQGQRCPRGRDHLFQRGAAGWLRALLAGVGRVSPPRGGGGGGMAGIAR